MDLPAAINRKAFSIIIATYNCGRKIDDTLQSIFSQNRDLFELIIIDGASTDDTLERIGKYDGDLTLISEKDAGVYYAFNKGIELASGEYVYFIGAGDCLRLDILERVNEALPRRETPTFFYGQCFFVNQQYPNGKEFVPETFVNNNICHQGIFYHRDIFEIVGKYDLKYKVFADWFFNLKCFIERRIDKQYVPWLIADFEGGGLSAEISRDPAFQKDFPVFVRKHFGLFKYLVCKTFLTNQHAFTYVYFKSIYLWGRATSAAKKYSRRLKIIKEPSKK